MNEHEYTATTLCEHMLLFPNLNYTYVERGRRRTAYRADCSGLSDTVWGVSYEPGEPASTHEGGCDDRENAVEVDISKKQSTVRVANELDRDAYYTRISYDAYGMVMAKNLPVVAAYEMSLASMRFDLRDKALSNVVSREATEWCRT
jgi:hypothetical protein